MLTVHHLARSQSLRIVWLCEELGLPYALRRHNREADGAAPAAYKALHPFGTAPVIEDDGLVLAESGAIVEYLCRVHGHGRLLPDPTAPDYADQLYWFHFGNGTLVPAIMLEMFAPPAGGGGPSRIERALAMIERRLAEAPWFGGGSPSAADVMMCLPLFIGGRDLAAHPAIRAYLDRAGDHPAYRRTMAAAEPAGAAA